MHPFRHIKYFSDLAHKEHRNGDVNASALRLSQETDLSNWVHLVLMKLTATCHHLYMQTCFYAEVNVCCTLYTVYVMGDVVSAQTLPRVYSKRTFSGTERISSMEKLLNVEKGVVSGFRISDAWINLI